MDLLVPLLVVRHQGVLSNLLEHNVVNYALRPNVQAIFDALRLAPSEAWREVAFFYRILSSAFCSDFPIQALHDGSTIPHLAETDIMLLDLFSQVATPTVRLPELFGRFTVALHPCPSFIAVADEL